MTNNRLLQISAVVWVSVAVLLRVYASKGGDASIVGGLLFLVWTAPFGLIWQFCISDMLSSFDVWVVQIVGDVVAVAAGAAFWFLFVPRVRRMQNIKRDA